MCNVWPNNLMARSYCAIFSDCDCDSSYRNKWVIQDSMEVFTLCDCDNMTNSYTEHYKQKHIAVVIRKKSHSVNEPLLRFRIRLFHVHDHADDDDRVHDHDHARDRDHDDVQHLDLQNVAYFQLS